VAKRQDCLEEDGLYGGGHMLNAVSGTDAVSGGTPRLLHRFAAVSQAVERDQDDAHD
jgi:hypothetical protein